MRINMSLEFESTAEMKVFLMSPHPFGAFLDNFAEAEAAEKAVADVRTEESKADLQETLTGIVEKPKRTRKKKSEAPTELAEALAAPVEPTEEPVAVAPVPVAPTEEVNVAPTPVTPAPVTPVTPVQQTAQQAVEQASQVAPAPTAAATYAIDDLARAAVQLIDAGRQAELMPLLQKYGVNALPDLAPEHTASFAADLRALGAAI